MSADSNINNNMA